MVDALERTGEQAVKIELLDEDRQRIDKSRARRTR
jgi:hypothetical protein